VADDLFTDPLHSRSLEADHHRSGWGHPHNPTLAKTVVLRIPIGLPKPWTDMMILLVIRSSGFLFRPDRTPICHARSNDPNASKISPPPPITDPI
jgi:hypothetical protein